MRARLSAGFGVLLSNHSDLNMATTSSAEGSLQVPFDYFAGCVTISPFPFLDFLIYFIIYATSHTFWKGGRAEQEPSPFTI